jgi:hypothetical protein
MAIEKVSYLNPVDPNLFSPGKQTKPKMTGAQPLPPVEFEVNDPEMMNETLVEDATEKPETEHYDNLVGELDERLTQRIGQQAKQWLERDLESRSAWR